MDGERYLQIERGIPIPPKHPHRESIKRPRDGRRTEVLTNLEVGESTLILIPDNYTNKGQQVSYISNSLGKLRGEGKLFTTRLVSQNELRVWRIK